MINRIGNPGILRFRSIIKIHFSIRGNNHILQQGIPFNGIENIRFTLLAQVDGLCIASPFKIEDAIIVPSMLIIPDQGTFGIG